MSITPIEKEIIDLLQKGDKRALNLLYENYSNSLYGVILKITINEEVAEDALQETFIKFGKMLQNTIHLKQNSLHGCFVLQEIQR